MITLLQALTRQRRARPQSHRPGHRHHARGRSTSRRTGLCLCGQRQRRLRVGHQHRQPPVVATIPVGVTPTKIVLSRGMAHARTSRTRARTRSRSSTPPSTRSWPRCRSAPRPPRSRSRPTASGSTRRAGGVIEAVDTALGRWWPRSDRRARPAATSRSPRTVRRSTSRRPRDRHRHGHQHRPGDVLLLAASASSSRPTAARLRHAHAGPVRGRARGHRHPSKASLAFVNLGVPGPLAIAPDGSRLYAGIDATFVNTGYGAGFFPGRTVAVIDTLTNSQVATIDLGATGPTGRSRTRPRPSSSPPTSGSSTLRSPGSPIVAAADVNTNAVAAPFPSPAPERSAPLRLGTVVPFLVNAVDDSAPMPHAGGTADHHRPRQRHARRHHARLLST